MIASFDESNVEQLKTLGKIIGVAIISHNGEVISLPKPNRHHNVIHYMVKELNHPTSIRGQQGFITENGTFVDRVSAKYIARFHNQLLEREAGLEELFSEDVW